MNEMDIQEQPEEPRIEQNGHIGAPADLKEQVRQNGLDTRHFRVLAQMKPRTKAAQVRQVWPEIKIALAAGHRLKDIRNWLNEVGIEIGHARPSDYVGQLKRQEAGLTGSPAIPQTRRSAAVNDKSPIGQRRTRRVVGTDRYPTSRNNSATPETDRIQGETEYGENVERNSRFAPSRLHMPCSQTKPSMNLGGNVPFWVVVSLIGAVIVFFLGFLVGRMQ